MKTLQHTLPSLPQIPQNLPCSVTLQPGPEDTGKVGLGGERGGNGGVILVGGAVGMKGLDWQSQR